MSRKKTKPDVRELRPNQWLFCQLYVAGHSQMKALVEAYPAAEKRTINQRRHQVGELMKAPSIQKGIRQARASMLDSTYRIDMGRWLEIAAEIRDGAIKEGKFGAARSAHKDIAQALGFMIERVHVIKEERTAADMRTRMLEIYEKNPNILGAMPEEAQARFRAMISEKQVIEVEATDSHPVPPLSLTSEISTSPETPLPPGTHIDPPPSQP